MSHRLARFVRAGLQREEPDISIAKNRMIGYNDLHSAYVQK